MIRSLAAAILLITPQMALAEEPAKPCLTRREAQDLTIFFVPTLLESAAGACEASLPANAFLRTGAIALADKHRPESELRWPGAKTALDKIGLAGTELSGLDKMSSPKLDAAKLVMQGVIRLVLTDTIKPGDCPTIDELARALSPLPAENLGSLVALLLELSSKTDGKKGGQMRDFRICPANSG